MSYPELDAVLVENVIAFTEFDKLFSDLCVIIVQTYRASRLLVQLVSSFYLDQFSLLDLRDSLVYLKLGHFHLIILLGRSLMLKYES